MSSLSLLSAWTLLSMFILAVACLTGALMLLQRQTADAVDEGVPPAKPLILVPQKQTSERLTGLQRELFQAGFSHPSAASRFMQLKWLAAFGASALAFGITRSLPFLAVPTTSVVVAMTATGFVLGFLLPSWVVARRRRAWKARIALALPDALDFMLISVEAGQSVDMAVLRVAGELSSIHPEMAARFHAVAEAMSAGASRYDAFMRMAQETESDDLRQFATIVIQAVSMGTPIVQTLRVFTADLRDRRVRQIEERANLLPTKMTLGTMIFTVPPLLILLLAPALYRITQVF